MSDCAKALILTFCSGLAGCKLGDTPEGVFPIGNDGRMIAGTSDALRDFVVRGGSKDWVREPAPHPSGAHGQVQTAFNDLYLMARRTSSFPMPVGAASVKEFLNGDNTHGGWTLSLKTKEGEGADTWTWWEGFAPDHQPSEFGVGAAACERCHGEARDRDRSLVDTVP
jgi:hypothetical protein